jgi:tetratricopeptide (TPR) repeat protein
MLDTLREFALERLDEAGDTALTRNAHAMLFTELAELAAPELRRAQDRAWLNRLEQEVGNFRAALSWLLDIASAETGPEAVGAAELGLRLATALSWFWYMSGRFWEGSDLLNRLLQLPVAADAGPLRAKALTAAGFLAIKIHSGSHPLPREVLREAAAAWRQIGDTLGLADALLYYGVSTYTDLQIAFPSLRESAELFTRGGDRLGYGLAMAYIGFLLVSRKGDAASAFQPLEEAAALFREIGAVRHLGFALHYLGLTSELLGDLVAARRLYEEAHELFRTTGDRWGSNNLSLLALGHLSRADGNYDQAAAYYQQALANSRDFGVVKDVATVLYNLGQTAFLRGDTDQARAFFMESLSTWAELENTRERAPTLVGLAGVAATMNDLTRAARLLGAAAEGMRATASAGLLKPYHQAAHDSTTNLVSSRMNEREFEAAVLDGRTMSDESLLAFALGQE